MLPFLLIQTRADDDVVADELRSTVAQGGFSPDQVVQLQLDREFAEDPLVRTENLTQSPIAEDAPADRTMAPRHFDWAEILDRHSGIILCGSPFNSTDPEDQKSALQLRVEVELRRMLDEVVRRDFPFFGACYGVSTLGLHQGAVVDRTYGEKAGAVPVSVTPQGRRDALLEGVETDFLAYVGHKEAISSLPSHAVLLVHGQGAPVQMFRIGQNMYATQFHPEVDREGFLRRLQAYAGHGYYEPERAQEYFRAVREAEVTQPQRILANFRRRYARSARS